jgi:hypothetical protein
MRLLAAFVAAALSAGSPAWLCVASCETGPETGTTAACHEASTADQSVTRAHTCADHLIAAPPAVKPAEQAVGRAPIGPGAEFANWLTSPARAAAWAARRPAPRLPSLFLPVPLRI